MQPDPSTVRDWLDLGVTGILAFALLSGFWEWWVYGPAHRRQLAELRKDRDFWRSAAIDGIHVARLAVHPAPPSDGSEDA